MAAFVIGQGVAGRKMNCAWSRTRRDTNGTSVVEVVEIVAAFQVARSGRIPTEFGRYHKL